MTNLAAPALDLPGVFARVMLRAVDLLAFLPGDVARAEDALHDAEGAEDRVPGLTVGVGLTVGDTYWTGRDVAQEEPSHPGKPIGNDARARFI